MKIMRGVGFVVFEKEEEKEAIKHFHEALRKYDKSYYYKLKLSEEDVDDIANVVVPDDALYDIFYAPLDEEMRGIYKPLDEAIEDFKKENKPIIMFSNFPFNWLSDKDLDYVFDNFDKLKFYCNNLENYDEVFIKISKEKDGRYKVSELGETFDGEYEEYEGYLNSKEELKQYLSKFDNLRFTAEKQIFSKDIEKIPAFSRMLNISKIIKDNLIICEEGNGYMSDPNLDFDREKAQKLYETFGISTKKAYKLDDVVFIQNSNSFSGYYSIFKLKATQEVLDNIEDITETIDTNLRVVREKELENRNKIDRTIGR